MSCNKDSNCPYAQGYHDVSRDLELCQSVFGIDPNTVKQNVDSTLSYYGGWSLSPNTGKSTGPDDSNMLDNEEEDTAQKRIIFITGDVDPWTELSYTKQGNEDHPSIHVLGASHHFWTHEVKESDGEHVKNARQTIYDTVSNWLGLSSGMNLVSSPGEQSMLVKTE